MNVGHEAANGGRPDTTDQASAAANQPQVTSNQQPATSSQTQAAKPWLIYLAIILLALVPILYLATLAQDVVFGDPAEYTFVANILGIAHPPGYAFITLLGKLFQSLIPVGGIPWRMHLLSALAATAGVLFVYGTVQAVAGRIEPVTRIMPGLDKIIAAFAALTVALAADWWQHAIHANPHIITAAFLSANLFFLTKWWAAGGGSRGAEEQRSGGEQGSHSPDRSPAHTHTPTHPHPHADRWLYLFAFSAGLGVTHHPLTVFSWLAYALFILVVRPGIWRQWKTLLRMAALALLGLGVWLYFPIRSAMAPAFGPDTMNTLDGFLDHVLGRGITESLPFFGLADQLDRATVFWTLLRLQYALPIIFLAVLGLAWLLVRKSLRSLALLYGLALLGNYLFVINLRQQDIMAYLLGVFLIIGLLAGIGLLGVLDILARQVSLDRKAAGLLIAAMFLLGPALQVLRNLPYISLRDYDEAPAYVEEVFDWFEGQGEGAILLNDWEHMTPLWYQQFVEDRWPDPADVAPHMVSTDMNWLESTFFYLPGHPLYLSGYRPEIAGAGFRLRPRGSFYQVVQPGDASIPPELMRIEPATAGELEIVAYQLPQLNVTAGDIVPLTLAMRAPAGTEAFYVPVVTLGQGKERILNEPLVFEFTTDGHLITPEWQPGEVIVERFDLPLPHDLEAGDYEVTVGMRDLSTGRDTELALTLGELKVAEAEQPIDTGRLLTTFRQRAGLVAAAARNGLSDRRRAPWEEPMRARPGDTINVTLQWQSLAPAEESYTVFVHLIDLANQPLVALDYTPLGGSTPTHLWIPKWLPGQQMTDPYRLQLPEDLPPGDYLIEAGLYEMTGGRRLHLADPAGNLVGDRYILGSVVIEP
ncbi:MAG: DUF2723 domain-containing protein [Chloroflexota bacterium]|nr:MAG: DUF2723 domain-containing protein [Chloroflexota bacterium]